MFLNRRLKTSVMLATTLSLVAAVWTWSLSVFALHTTSMGEVVLHILALPWWALSAPAYAVIDAGVPFLLSWGVAVPLQQAPPPFAIAWNPRHVPGEIAATALAAVLCIVIYTIFIYAVLPHSRFVRSMIGCMVAALLLVALRLPLTIVTDPPRVVVRVGQAARLVTLLPEAAMGLLHLPVLFETGPGGSPPLRMQSLALSVGELVLVSALLLLIFVEVVRWVYRTAPRSTKV